MYAISVSKSMTTSGYNMIAVGEEKTLELKDKTLAYCAGDFLEFALNAEFPEKAGLTVSRQVYTNRVCIWLGRQTSLLLVDFSDITEGDFQPFLKQALESSRVAVKREIDNRHWKLEFSL